MPRAFRKRFEAQTSELREDGETILLAKPETFMNLSGRSVRQIIDFYKLELKDLLILSDDLALPLGKLRVKGTGSHGGQNGLRNIQEQLGTVDYARLRLGIGAPPPFVDPVDHVLNPFRPGRAGDHPTRPDRGGGPERY